MLRIGTMVFAGLVTSSLLFGCGDKNAPLTPQAVDGATGPQSRDGGPVSFALDILPLMQRACSCHTDGSTAPALDTYANVKASAAASNATIQNGTMPIAAPLSAPDKALFAEWLSAGMPNN